MSLLGNGLYDTNQYEHALLVREAQLATMRRVGNSESNILAMQGNLAGTYQALGRLEEALRMKRDVYSGWLKLVGEEHELTLVAANNYANTFSNLHRFEEAKSLLRKTIPVARRVFGEGNNLTLKMRKIYAQALYKDAVATLEDLHEAVATLEDVGRIARRVLGGTHPFTKSSENEVQNARAALRASALSSKATEDTCRRLREEIAQLKAENAELRRHRINNNTS